MSEDFIDELRNALDKGTVLSGGDIDARYHHDLAGNPAPKPRAVVRPKTTEDVATLLRLCHRDLGAAPLPHPFVSERQFPLQRHPRCRPGKRGGALIASPYQNCT